MAFLSKLKTLFFFFKGGFLWDALFQTYYIQHYFICRPSDSTVPTDAGIEPRTVATGTLKGQCHEIFASGFFYESVSPQLQSIPLGPFRICSKIRGDIRKSKCTTGVNDTGGKFATGVNDTGGKLPPVSTTTTNN
jgi:hypothetical protein